MTKKLITTVCEIEDAEHDREAGPAITIECPNCHSKVHFAKYGWWETRCSCGKWDYEFNATLEPFDD